MRSTCKDCGSAGLSSHCSLCGGSRSGRPDLTPVTEADLLEEAAGFIQTDLDIIAVLWDRVQHLDREVRRLRVAAAEIEPTDAV